MSETTGKKKKRRHPVRRAVILLLLLALAGGIGWFSFQRVQAEYRVTYDGYTATTGSISNALSFSGSLALINSETYTASQAATVRQTYVSVGDMVKKDDRIARLSTGETISAAFDGRVNKMEVAKGDELRSGATIAQVADFEHLKVSLRVDEYDIADVAVGQACRVTVTATGARFDSTISSIDFISSSQGSVAYYTATVYVDVGEAANVYPGMQVTVTVPKEEAENVVVLKMEALSFDRTNSAFVYVQGEDGAMTEKKVTVGVSNGNYVEIRDGVRDGDVVYAVSKTKEDTGFASMFSSLFGSQRINQPSGFGTNNRTQNRNNGGGTRNGGGSR